MAAETLNELPKNFQPAEAEARMRTLWEEGNYFHADNSSAAESYTIVIPPPNVTGALHLGHGLVQTIQDTLIRHHRMLGDNTLWVPGTDHAGIATQHVVVEKLRSQGRDYREMGREAFIEEAWKWKEQYHARITGQIKQLGCSVDWEREAFTLDDQRERAVRRAFKHLFDKELIYRGKYMVNWDPVSLTALADDEVEYEEEQGHLWHLQYPLTDGSGYVQVATTRPETMLGDTAVAVNPTDERYAHLVGMEIALPLTGRRIQVIADDFVAKDFGTGMVKITPAHDPNDFQCARRHGLEMIDIFTDDAKVNDNAPEKYRGMDRYVAREAVLADLKEGGYLVKTEPHTLRVGRGYRSKSIVEPRLSDQWFVKVEPLARRAAQAVRDGEVRILPKQMENTYFAWMDNLRDWCISRQLWWGHRIPIWYRRDDPSKMICRGEPGIPPEVEQDPDGWVQDSDVLDTWFSSALWPFSVFDWPDETQDLKTYFPTSVLVTGHDILFFWVARMIMFSYELTGTKPFSDVFLHGLIFGKSYYRRRGGDMELIGPAERAQLEEMEKLPAGVEYKWEKMSKSKGNVIDPLEMFERYGVDSTRIALVAYSGQGRTIEIDRHRIEGYRNFINKLWNAARFVLSGTEDVTARQFRGGVPTQGIQEEDLWILTRLSQTTEGATKALAEYRFDEYVSTIYQFFWTEYCDWYVELTKSRVYGQAGDAASSLAAKIVLLTVLEHTLRLLHPVIPYASEEIWHLMRGRLADAKPGKKASAPERPAGDGHTLGFADAFAAPSLCIAKWPEETTFADDSACQRVALLRDVVGAIRNIRGEMGVPMDARLEVLVQEPNDARREYLERAAAQVRQLAGVGTLNIAAQQAAAPFAASWVSGDLTVQVLVSDEFRMAEVERLEKELGFLEKGLNATRGKLTNEKFTAKAPENVVLAEREKLSKYEADAEAIKSRLAALKG